MAQNYYVGSVQVAWYGDELMVQIEHDSKTALQKTATAVAREARKHTPVEDEPGRPVYKTGPNAGEPWTARVPGLLKKSVRRRTVKKKSLDRGTLAKCQVIMGRRSGRELTPYWGGWIEFGAKGRVQPGRHVVRLSLWNKQTELMQNFENAMK